MNPLDQSVILVHNLNGHFISDTNVKKCHEIERLKTCVTAIIYYTKKLIANFQEFHHEIYTRTFTLVYKVDTH